MVKRRAVSDVPMRGGSTVSILVENITHFVVFDHFDPLYMYPPLINGVESDVTKKSLIFLLKQPRSEKFSPCGGPPTGSRLKRRAASGGPLRGGYNTENVSKFECFCFRF